MEYTNFDLIINNKNKNIFGYKYKNDIDNNIKEHFTKCFKDWKGVSDMDILKLKEYVAKLTDNNIDIYGYTTKDCIVLNNNNKNVHYYINFNNDKIDLWYFNGTYYDNIIDDDFDILLMMLSY